MSSKDINASLTYLLFLVNLKSNLMPSTWCFANVDWGVYTDLSLMENLRIHLIVFKNTFWLYIQIRFRKEEIYTFIQDCPSI